MTEVSGPPRTDPRRKARFREIARSIVAKDRYNRKYGIAVDTAGAIAPALERAYRDGVRDDPAVAPPTTDQHNTGPLEWALIPPRPRDAFWSICLFILGREAGQARDGYLAPAVTERGTPGWILIVPGYSHNKVIGDRTAALLLRLGLIERAADQPARLVIAPRGQETWALFCQRGGQYPEDLTDI